VQNKVNKSLSEKSGSSLSESSESLPRPISLSGYSLSTE